MRNAEARPDHPAFDSLMGGAFNQDWKDDWGGVEEVLTAALDGFPATRKSLLLELIEIERTCSEEEVIALLEGMGSGFRPEVDAYTSAIGWIRHLIQRIRTLDEADRTAR